MVRLADGPKASLVPGSPGTGAAAPGKLPGKLFTIFVRRFTEPETAVKLQFDSFNLPDNLPDEASPGGRLAQPLESNRLQ